MKLTLNDFDHTRDGYTLQTAYGLTVHVALDQHAENPLTASDVAPPILWTPDVRLDLESSQGCESFFNRVSAPWVSRHWRAICEILDLDPAEHDSAIDDTMADWIRGGRGEARQEAFEHELRMLQPGNYRVGASDFLDALHTLYKIAKTPALRFTRRGYSQGDVISGLVVLTPEWCKTVGYESDSGGESDARQMEATADLLGAWAFGNVYGFAIEGESCDHLDSCWGFYGDPEDSGVLDDAADALRRCLGARLACVGAELAAAARFAAGPYYPAT